MTLNMFKVENTNMYGTTYTPEAQIFIHFALWWAIFELRANFQKSPPNDHAVANMNTWQWQVKMQMTLTCSRSK